MNMGLKYTAVIVVVVLLMVGSASSESQVPKTEEVEKKASGESESTWTEWAKDKISGGLGLKDDSDGDTAASKASQAIKDKTEEAGQYGSDKTYEAYSSAKDKAGDAKDKTYETYSSVKDKAGDAFNSAKETAHKAAEAVKKTPHPAETVDDITDKVNHKLTSDDEL